jgi:signal transduction histidine kinase
MKYRSVPDSSGTNTQDQGTEQGPAKASAVKPTLDGEGGIEQPQTQVEAQRVVILLQAFQTITDAALAHLPLEEVLHRLLVPVRVALAADCAGILLLGAKDSAHEDNNGLVVRASVGPEDEAAHARCIQSGRSIAEGIMQTRAPLVVDDTRKLKVARSSWRAHVRSLMGVPLLAGPHMLGALFVATIAPRHFVPDEVVLLQIVADRVARTIAHAQLDAAERAARQQAEEAVRLRDYVLAQTSHDLRTPLTLIAGRSSLIQHQLERDQPVDRAWLRSQMAYIDSAVQRMVGAIDDLTDIARLQMGEPLPLDVTEIDSGLLVHEVVAEYVARESGLPIGVTTPAEALMLHGDRVRLARVLHNLIGNAIKYSPARTQVEVRVCRFDEMAVITIHDRGVGIPAAEL